MGGDANEILRQAKGHLETGRWGQAAALLDLALAGGAAAPEALLMRGVAAQRLGDNALALSCLDRAASAAPENELIHYNRAAVLQAAGRLDEATAGYRRAIALKARRLGIGGDALARRVFDGRIAAIAAWARGHGADYRAWPCADDDSRPLPAHVHAPFCPAANEDFVAVIDDARVVAGSVRASHFQYVLTPDDALLADRLNFIPRYHLGHGMSFAKTIAADGAALIDLLDFPEAAPRAGRFVLLGGVRNYYHWLFEYLPRVELIRRCPDLAIDGWLVNAGPARFQLETLAALGIDERALVPLAAPAVQRIERLYVPSVRRLHDAVGFLRAQFVAQPPAAGARRLFVSRRDAQTARVANEDAVFAALEPLGFERVTGSALTVAQQAALFADAATVVGVHGAGLANIVFAPSTARIVELAAGTTRAFAFYSEIARARGQRHSVVQAAVDGAVDPQHVVALVRAP